ncbi:MAG: TlpA disulfide reductase family protein [Blastocatellia bacterium]
MLTRAKTITAAVVIVSCLAANRASAQQDFSFATPAGQTVTIASMRGRVVVLLFSGVQDPQCREGLKALEALADRFQGKDVRMYWVSVNSLAEASNEQLGTPCGVASSVPVLRDTNQTAFKRFSGKRSQLPTIVVLDRQGNLVGQPRGGFNPNSDFINDLAVTIDKQLK